MLGAPLKMLKIAAVAAALSGFGLVASPRQAEAAPIAVPVEATAPQDGTATAARWHRGHRGYHRHRWHRHRHHFHRHHRRGHWRHHHRRHWR